MGEQEDKTKKLNERLETLEAEVEATKAENEKLKTIAANGPHTSTRAGTSFESKAIQAFGKTSIKQLLHVNVCDPYFNHVPMEYKMAVRSFKEALDIGRYISQIFHGDPRDKGGTDEKNARPSNCKNILETNWGKTVLAPMAKAFGTGADGADWIPTALSSQFIEEFELDRRVATAFREMPMPTNPFEIPLQTSVTVARKATENTAMTGNSFTTDKLNFNATKLGEFYPLPEELNEDSAPNILAIGRGEVAEAQIRARETWILNGDDTGTHMDTDTTAADDARKIGKGLRKLALDNSANGSVIDFGGAVTTAKLDEMRVAMGKFGVNVRDLMWFFSPSTYHQAVALDEVTTVDKFGPQATIHNGTLAAFRGIPIMISEYVREDVDDNGVNSATPANNIKGLVHLTHARRFWVGMRRPIRVRVQMDLPDQDRWLLASYSRIDFKGLPQSATEVSAALGINVTL